MTEDEKIAACGGAADAPADGGGAEAGSGRENPPAGMDAAPAPEPERAGEAEVYLAQLQRLKADFDNYRRRMMQEQARWADAAVGRFIGDLLPVVDNLERALVAGGDAQAVRQGVELTLRQLHEQLEQAGVGVVHAVGQPFDPTYHEAMLQVETSEHGDGQVMEELRKGYLFKRQVLRPALVKVARAPQQTDAPAGGPAASGGSDGGEDGGERGE